jgi:hypothetical protein
MATTTSYGSYASIANNLIDFWGTTQQLNYYNSQARRNYNYMASQTKNSFNQMLADYGASRSELDLQGLALLGTEKSIEANRGIVNLGKKKDGTRGKRLQLLQTRAQITNNLNENIDKLRFETNAQIKANTKMKRLQAFSTAIQVGSQIAMML